MLRGTVLVPIAEPAPMKDRPPARESVSAAPDRPTRMSTNKRVIAPAVPCPHDYTLIFPTRCHSTTYIPSNHYLFTNHVGFLYIFASKPLSASFTPVITRCHSTLYNCKLSLHYLTLITYPYLILSPTFPSPFSISSPYSIILTPFSYSFSFN